jgi:hypothetical protein
MIEFNFDQLQRADDCADYLFAWYSCAACGPTALSGVLLVTVKYRGTKFAEIFLGCTA